MIPPVPPPRRPTTLLFWRRARIVRFALTGGIAALLQLGLLNVLLRLGWSALVAEAAAFGLATQLNFGLSSAFTWGDRPLDGAGLAGRWLRYHIAIAASALLNLAVFALADGTLPNLGASALGIVAAAACNYLSGDRLVFSPLTPVLEEPSMTMAWTARVRSAAPAAALIALATLLYVWNLAANGDGNQYYAAAVLSMTLSWKAFFFGAIDSAAFITVDKPPLAFWLQALLARAIGFSSWSILLPQAAATLASVLVVYRLARHQFGGVAGIVSGLVFALTPITVAIARDNIPDAVLIALMVGGAWATFDAIRTGRLGSLLMAGALVGLAFNTKMLQAYLVVPTLAATYLIAASGSLLRRVRNLAAAGVVLAIVSASWLTVVDAIPANARPFVGGSADDTVLNLVLGYNGVERILGREAPEIITEAYGRGVGFGGAPGPTRLFSAPLDGQISWLLPLAAGSLIAGLVSRGRRGRTDLRRAWFVLWGGWLAVHAVVLSFARGGFHPYYTATMAPAIAALVGPGSIALWRLYRRSRAMAWLLPVSIGGTAAWAAFLIARADWLPWLAPAVVVAGGAAVAGLLVGRVRPSGHGRRVARGAALLGLIAVLAGPVAWSAAAVTSRVNGNNPLAGPASAQVFAGLGGGPQLMGGARARGTNGFWPMGGAGGRVSDALIGYLRENRGSSTWLVAVPSANRAAPIILETGGEPVMAIGGFSGRDPAPTLAQLGELVATGALRYVLLEDGGPGRGNSEIAAWVQGNGTLVDAAAYGGQGDGELYDLRPSPA